MRRTSIRFRLMILMICLTTLPVITVTWIATNNTRDSVEKEIIEANRSRMMWADQYLDELIQQMDILFYTLQINDELMTGLHDIDSTDIATLTSVFYANSRKVDDLTLYMHSNKRAFSVNFANSGIISLLDISNGPWSRMLHSPINMYFKQSANRIYAFHSINRFVDRELLGGIAVLINHKTWEEVSVILQSESESLVFLINDEGEMLSGSTVSEETSEIQEQLQNLDSLNSELKFLRTDNYFYFMKRIDDGQLTVVKAIPSETITQSTRSTINAGILTGSLFALASILLSILVSLRISRPIVSLARTMRNTHIHNFELKSIQSNDEIGLLERGYNSMMQRIKGLIEVEYQREIEVKNAQLMALQAQINPHFLNNTLHLIGGMALSKDAPEIYQITRVIGDLLRYSISTEGDMVTIEDELKHVRNYIFIQEQRFVGRCKVVVVIDESARRSRLPKFTIQPMVENAFEHGLQRKLGSWRLEVRVKRIGERIVLMIKDEGIGLSEERLHELRTELKGELPIKTDRLGHDDARKRRGIGLRNVDARLKLQFGESYGVRLFSRAGVGTLIVMVIPVTRMEVAQHV